MLKTLDFNFVCFVSFVVSGAIKEWAFECVWDKLTEDTNGCDGTESERHWCMVR